MLPKSTHRHAARAAILATCIAATALGSTPGEVDPTFGVSGRTVVADHSKAIGLRLPDGSLLVASQATETLADTPTTVELRRFDSEGHADPHFGTAGIAHHEFPDMTDLMQSAVRAAEGRVYFGGWTRHLRDGRGWFDMAVYAVDAQGAAVTSFGDGGLVSYDLKEGDNARAFDSAAALAVMPDGHLLAAAFSANGNNHFYGDEDPNLLPQLLRLNADGSLDRNIGFGQGSNVCSGIAGLLVRTDGALLVGDDTGLYALLDDAVLQAFGVDGHVVDEHWYPYAGCTGTRSFAPNPSGELLTLSAVNLRDGQLGIALNRLQDNGIRVEGAAQAPPVPLARLVGDDARFAGLSVYHIVTSRPVQSAADDRVYVLFGFSWSNSASANDFGGGWAIARFAEDGTLDTGWGEGGVVVLEKGGHGYWNTVPTLLEPLPDGRIVAMSANGVLTRLFGGQREGHGAINIDAGRDFVEDAVQVSIEVTRTGGSAGAVSVEYSTTGDIDAERATEGRDFTAVSGRLDWADGDSSSREIVIPILEDTLKESDERFAVDIRSPSGGAVLLNTRALLGISDDADTSTPPPPPPNDSSGGGGATDGLTLILLISLIALSVAERRRKAEGRWWPGASMRLIHASVLATSLATASLPVSQADTYQPVAAPTQEAPQRVIHVDDDSTLGGNGSTRWPYNNLADALSDARTTSAAVVIDVAPGRYVIDSTLVIDRSLVLRGSSVMSEGTQGLPTGGIAAGTATHIVGSEALGPAPLITVGRSDGVVIKEVTIRGFVFKGAADYFGTELNFTRVQGLVVAGNVFRAPARFGIETIASSGRVDENHFSRLQTGAVFTGGYPASPSKVTFRANRSVRNDLGGVLLSGASISIPELGDQLDATVRDNDLSDNGAFGVRLFIVRRDLGAPGDSQSTGHINALLRGNRIARNVTGVLIDAGFPFRQVDDTCDPRLYSGTIDLRLEDNTVSGSRDVASWITFTRWPGAQDPESLASWQYLHATTFTITDRQRVLGDIAIDHPERDPFVGPCPGDEVDEPLDNVLRYNGVVLPNGRNY